MSKQASAGGPGTEPGTEILLAVQVNVRRNSPPESKKSSPLKKSDVTASPTERGLRSGFLSSPELAKESLHSHLSSPSKRANVDKQNVEVPAKKTPERGNMDKIDKAPCPQSLQLEFPIDAVNPNNESMNVSDDANEKLGKGVEVVLSLQTVTLDTEPGSEENIHNAATSVKFQSSEEATLSSDVSKDTSLCRQFENVVLSSLEEDTKAVAANENHDRALSASTSSPRPATLSSGVLGTAETMTDANGFGDQGMEGIENLNNEQSWDRNPESSDDRRMISLDSVENESDPCVFHEGGSIKSDSSRLDVDHEMITALTCDATGSPNDSELGMKDDDTSGNTGTNLVTDDTLTIGEIPNPMENTSQPPPDNVGPHLDGLDHPEPVAESTRMTRSGSRFSEETNMLRDFLSRAQARKAARDVPAFIEVADVASPRRSPRKPLAEIHNKSRSPSPSPEKTVPVSQRPGTPPGTAKLQMGELDELDGLDELDELEEAGQQTSSYRRSTRTRLFTPARPAPGAPSLIPVRRAEGGDKVRLPQSLAQELATLTRSNTRRNRGESKPPKLVLQSLPVEPSTVGLVSPKGEGCGKSVGWDAPLVYYQPISGVSLGKERRRRKRNGPVEAPGEGSGSVGLKKETTVASTVGARLGSHGRGRNKK